MKMNHKTVLIYALGSLLLIACGAKAKEHKQVPAATSAPSVSSEEKSGKEITPQQQDQKKLELQYEEDAVFDVVPG